MNETAFATRPQKDSSSGRAVVAYSTTVALVECSDVQSEDQSLVSSRPKAHHPQAHRQLGRQRAAGARGQASAAKEKGEEVVAVRLDYQPPPPRQPKKTIEAFGVALGVIPPVMCCIYFIGS